MAVSFAQFFITTSLLFSQQVQGSNRLPVCSTKEASVALIGCKTNFLQYAGKNFTDDCEAGIVEEFMTCINQVEGCSNLSAFLENAFYNYYGCEDTSIRVQKRGFVGRFMCSLTCTFVCGLGELATVKLVSIWNYALLLADCFPGVRTCTYVCRRSCRNSCRWEQVWQWIPRFGRDVPVIAPEESNDLTPEEIEYIHETDNLCTDCVCSIGKQKLFSPK
jgi:hypothetical protein